MPEPASKTTTAESATVSGKLRRPSVWVSTSYFAEGVPYSVINTVIEALFKHLGASLAVIGLTSILHLPWNLKFLWGPLVDSYETKRAWMLVSQFVLSILLLASAFVVSIGEIVVLTWVVLALVAFMSATQDVAVDGLYLEALDEEGRSKYVGLRAPAYRVGMMFVGGPMLVFAANFGWTAFMVVCAGIMAILALVHGVVAPRTEIRKRGITEMFRSVLRLPMLLGAAALSVLIGVELKWRPAAQALDVVKASLASGPFSFLGNVGVGGWIAMGLLFGLIVLAFLIPVLRRKLSTGEHPYVENFVSFLDQPKAGLMLAFIICNRVGESLLVKMRYAFLVDHLDYSLEAYGWAKGTFGVLFSIAATIGAGWLISKHGLRRWFWPFLVAQNLLNLLYVPLAMAPSADAIPYGGIAAVIIIEEFGAGLGTAVLMVYMMRCCNPKFKAGHMAIVTSVMSVGFTVAGMVSGVVAEATGFVVYFILCFVATIPAMVLALYVPHLDSREELDEAQVSD